MNRSKQMQRGAVSLFIVIFAALLIITIVTAFVRIMVQDQQQATASDLAKSAMDSAQAGVEDSKRALVEYYKKNCPEQLVDSRCVELRTALLDNVDANGWTSFCDTTRRAGVATVVDGEVKVETDAKDAALDQAYTCVKVQMNPENYIGTSTSQLVQLKAKDNAPFDKVKIEWYEQQDDEPLELDDGTAQNYELLDVWPPKRPQVLRLQLLQYGADFALDDFDGNYQNNSSLFLLPTSIPGLTTGAFASDLRKSKGSQSTQKVGCTPQPAVGDYGCEITIDLPQIGTPAGNTPRNAYLKVDQLYASGNKKFSITLLSTQPDGSAVSVRFSDVQVAVDSTGRANEMFKRIQSRVDIGGGVPTPDAAVDVTRSFCKEFLVTTDTAIAGNNSEECPRLPGS